MLIGCVLFPLIKNTLFKHANQVNILQEGLKNAHSGGSPRH